MVSPAYILIVDDSPENLQVIATILKEQEYKLSLALDGKSALTILESIKIDLILLDVMMPEMDGYEVCKKIKENPLTKDIPVIFLTALNDANDIANGFNAGGVDYITKPIRSKELCVRVKNHLSIAALQQSLSIANENLEQKIKLRTSQLTKANIELCDKIDELHNTNILLSNSIAERNKLQQQMILAIIKSEENERTRISQELHDGLGPILTTIKLFLQWLDKPDALKDKAELIKQTVGITEEAITSLKEISNKLSPHVLVKYGIETAIESFINKITTTAKINFIVKTTLTERLNNDIEIFIYRVVIECINNTIKYANANNVTIDINKISDNLYINYTDDGVGFDLKEVKDLKLGLGLLNMQNRVETLNGSFNITSSLNNGVKVEIKIPYNVIGSI